MRTIFAKLIALVFTAILAILLLTPMRSGLEDHLYARPRKLRMHCGNTYALSYALDSDRPQSVTYTSLDESIATVSADGRVTAVNPGSTDIHLKAEGGARTMVHVDVSGIPTTHLSLNTEYVAMEKGDVTELSASFNENADDKRLEWRSADPEIASVDSVGRVTALRGGRTQIYATTPNGLSAASDIFVHVPGDMVRITPEALTLGTGATLQMGTYYFPDDATDEVYNWNSNNNHILTAEADGTVHAVGVGTVVLSVFTKEGLSASSVVRVEQSAERFDLSPSAVTIERGDELQLESRFFNADGTLDEASQSHYIVWKSSNPDVATVENGRVTGLKSGSTQISATVDGMTAICSLQVQVLVHSVTLDKEEVYMLAQGTDTPIQLKATISPIDPDDPTITYSTSNDLVANVSADGLVTMTGAYGTAIITARAASGAEAHFTVNIVTELPDPESIPNAVILDGKGNIIDEPLKSTLESPSEAEASEAASLEGDADASEGDAPEDGYNPFDESAIDVVTPEDASTAEPGGTAAPTASAAPSETPLPEPAGAVEQTVTVVPTNTPRRNMSEEDEAATLFR